MPSAEEFKEIIKNAPITIYEIDFDGSKIRTVNSAVTQWLGYSEEEILAMNPLNLLSEESRKKFQEIVTEALIGNKTLYSSELEVRAKNGQSVWGLFHAKINLKNGKPDSVLVFVQDITERKKAEEELRESRNILDSIINSTTDMIWTISSEDFRLLTFNKALSDYYLKTRNLRLEKGMATGQLMPNEQIAQQFIGFIKESLRTGSFSTLHTTLIEPRTLELNFNALKDGGKPFAISVFGRDITERKKAEEERRISEQKLQDILNAMDDGIVLIGLDGRVTDCNEATLKQSNMKIEEIIGKVIMDYMVSDNKENFIKETQETLRKTGRARVETQVLRKNDSPLPVEVSLTRF